MVTSASTNGSLKTIIVTLQPSTSPVNGTASTSSSIDQTSSTSGSTTAIAIGASVAVVVLLLAVGLYAFMRRRNRQRRATIEDIKMTSLHFSKQQQEYHGNNGMTISAGMNVPKPALRFDGPFNAETISKPVAAFNQQQQAQEHQNQLQSLPEKPNPLFGSIPHSNQLEIVGSSTAFREQNQHQYQQPAWQTQRAQNLEPIFKSRDEFSEQPVQSPQRSKATYDPSQIGQATSQGAIILPSFDEISSWDRDRVANLLDSMELSSRVVSTLHARNVTGYELLVMTEDRLLEFGIHQAIAREIILSVVARLRQGSSASVGVGLGGGGSGSGANNNLPEAIMTDCDKLQQFNSPTGCCSSEKIRCSPSGRIQELHLEGAGLKGDIGSFISTVASFSELTFLDIRSNTELLGSIQEDLGKLTGLIELYIGGSGDWPNKVDIHGGIPQGIGNLVKLKKLWLRGTNVDGSIPIGISNLANLEELRLDRNSLSGSVPETFGSRFQRVVNLDISLNALSGLVPVALAEMTSVQTMWLGWNKFEGVIPSQLAKLQNIQRLWLNDNQLVGTVPQEFNGSPMTFL
ncbi:hypothetical protein HDU97_002299 [Phlyctochytrium planicorne]|nr:hypothetical protein HDU97_002299 [Phlyctochytrium planicorne]